MDCLSTGFEAVDAAIASVDGGTGGYPRGQLTVVSSRTGVGRTRFALRSFSQNHRVLLMDADRTHRGNSALWSPDPKHTIFIPSDWDAAQARFEQNSNEQQDSDRHSVVIVDSVNRLVGSPGPRARTLRQELDGRLPVWVRRALMTKTALVFMWQSQDAQLPLGLTHNASLILRLESVPKEKLVEVTFQKTRWGKNPSPVRIDLLSSLPEPKPARSRFERI